MKIKSIDLNWIMFFLTLLLTALKLDGVIDWAWLWIISPIWLLFIGAMFLVVIVIARK